MRKTIERLLLLGALLAPLLLLVALAGLWRNRDPVLRLREPGDYPWEFRVVSSTVKRDTHLSPLLPADSLAGQRLVDLGGGTGYRSLLFEDPATRNPAPPYWNRADSLLSLDRPWTALDGEGRAWVALLLDRVGQAPELACFATEVDGSGRLGGAPVELGPPPGGARLVEAPAGAPIPWRTRSRLLAFGELLAEAPGPEAVVQSYWQSSDFRRQRVQVDLYSIECWQRRWSLELPTCASGAVMQPDAEGGPRLLLSSDTPCNGREALGLDDSRAWLVAIGLRDGRVVGEPFLPGGPDAPPSESRAIAVPGDVRRVLYATRAKTEPDSSRDALRLLDANDLGTLAQRGTGPLLDWMVVPAGRRSGGFAVLGKTADHRLRRWNARLEPDGELRLADDFQLIGAAPALDGSALPGAFLLGSSSGRLLLVDGGLRVLCADALVEGPLRVIHGAQPDHAVLPRYRVDGAEHWILNTGDAALVGVWHRRSPWARRAAGAALATAFAWLLFWLLVLARRQRFARAARRVLFGRARDPILLLDAGGRTMEANRGFEELLQAAAPQAPAFRPGRPAADLLRRAGLSELAARLDAPAEWEGRLQLPQDGQPAPFGVRLEALEHRGGRVGWALILQDRVALLAGHRSQTLNLIAEGSAHNMKSPLQAVLLNAESLLRQLRGEGATDRERMRCEAEDIAFLARALATDIDDLLRVGHRDVELAPVDPATFLKRYRKLLQRRAGRPDIRVELAVDEGLPRIRADRFFLLSVLLQLVDNAIKAVGDRGSIVVSARPLGDAETAGDGRLTGGLRLEVADDGSGLDPGELDRFCRPGCGRFRNGHGIGLAVVRTVVHDHGGRLSVDSRPGQGARFRIDLPRWTKIDEEPTHA